MTSTGTQPSQSFVERLAAPRRSAEIPESSDVYGWLVGSWHFEAMHYKAVDVSPLALQGEVHFGWVLEGRAIQDVWIMPRCSERNPDLSKTNNMYGTTLRVWDPAMQDGTPTRWRFVEITANSFHWIGEALDKDGSSWKLEGEFRATRIR
jgi:hypothetical protein